MLYILHEKGKDILYKLVIAYCLSKTSLSLSISLSIKYSRSLILDWKTYKKLISVKGECNLYSACSTLSSIKQITTKCEGSKLGNISHNAAFVVYCFKLKKQNFFNRKCFCYKKSYMYMQWAGYQNCCNKDTYKQWLIYISDLLSKGTKKVVTR